MRSALFCVFVLVSLSGSARAQSTARVVAVASDVELARALGEALTPWDVSLVLEEAADLDLTTQDPAVQGRELASLHEAEAVVWLSESSDGWAIWIYDAETNRATARPLPVGPPFDEPTAAALALSVVTMLRQSAVAPPEERIRASAESASTREVRIELAAGAEGWASSPDQVEPRVEVAIGCWPSAWRHVAGIEFALRFGSGVPVELGGLSARLFDLRALARGHLRMSPERWLLMGLILGLGARIQVLDGSHVSGLAVSELRVSGVLELAAEVGLDIDPVVIAIRVGATATPWLEPYEANRAPVLELNPVWPFAELAGEVSF